MKKQLLKKQLKSALLAVLAFMPLAASAQVEINETNFPDENFRKYLLRQWYGEDGVISDSEIKQITIIYVNSENISSLKGIEHFTALKTLYCDDTQLTSLDVSACTDLTELRCSNNTQLTTLNVSNCTSLTLLQCTYNQLSTLNLSNCSALDWLMCMDNQLTSLDVSSCTSLKALGCDENQLAVLDISANIALEYLECGFNKLTSLDISQNTALSQLGCADNQLTTLDVSNNPLLNYLWCSHNIIEGTAMDAFIESLPQNTTAEEYSLFVYDNIEGIEGNVCTKNQVAAAKAKGWIPRYWDGTDWTPYEGSEESTGITSVEVEDANAPIYDLSGKRVNNLQGKKGIYIIGGKKVLKK